VETKERLEYLRIELQEDRLIRNSMFEGGDLEAWDERALGEYEGEMYRIELLLKEAEADSVGKAAVDLVDEIRQIACDKAKSSSTCLDFLGEEDQELFCNAIGMDFARIAQALLAGVDDPFLNGVWLTYRSGAIPYEPILVQGHLAELIDVSPDEAARLLAVGQGQFHEGKAQEEAEHDALGKAVASISGPIPDGDLLLKLIGHTPNLRDMKAPNTRIVTTAKHLDPAQDVPDSWRDLLAAQDASRRPPWDAVWGEFRDLLPAAYVFLEEFCRGVAVLFREEVPPALLYVYAYPSDRFACRASFSCYYGGHPLGKEVPPAHAKKLELLPPRLQEFYHSVHNGWATCNCIDHGPMELERMQFLGEDLTEEECFGTREPPFHLNDALEVARMHGGPDVVCLDTGHRTPEGESPAVIWWSRDPTNPSVNLDFWEQLNRAVAEGYQGLSKTTELRPEE
jgi:hypothetical protein